MKLYLKLKKYLRKQKRKSEVKQAINKLFYV